MFSASVLSNELVTYKSCKVTIPADQKGAACLPSIWPKGIRVRDFIYPVNKLVPIMEIKMGSYNCRGFNVSKVHATKELLNDCDVLLLQETWLLPHELKVFKKYFIVCNCCSVSGINSEVLYHGRPFGGCSVLSDHLPLFVLFKCFVSYVNALPRIFNARPNWRWTDSKIIKFYKTVLDIKLK